MKGVGFRLTKFGRRHNERVQFGVMTRWPFFVFRWLPHTSRDKQLTTDEVLGRHFSVVWFDSFHETGDFRFEGRVRGRQNKGSRQGSE